MPSITIGCDTNEKVNLFRDILEKTINEHPTHINREGAISIIFDFYLANYNKSKRTRELMRRSEYQKRKAWEKETIEKIHKEDHKYRQIVNNKLITQLEGLIKQIKWSI